MDANHKVIFSQRAFNAIVTETISKHPFETGGFLLGYFLRDKNIWIVVENIPPGLNAIHQTAFFQIDKQFANYLANVIDFQYKNNMEILGLWHRHPGSMDVFSGRDNSTNSSYARENPAGAISILVNCDPQLRMTVYHIDVNGNSHVIDWFVDDGHTIPDSYFALRYSFDSEMPIFDNNGVVNLSLATSNDVVEAQKIVKTRTMDKAESQPLVTNILNNEPPSSKLRGWSCIKDNILKIFKQ